MSCPSRTRRRSGAAEMLGGPSRVPVGQERGVVARTADRLRRDDALAQFTRFVVVGATSTALYAVLFLSLRSFGYLPAHVVATVASSILANELHRRLTFHAEERVGWLTAQVEAGGVSFVGLVATSSALRWLDTAAGDAHRSGRSPWSRRSPPSSACCGSSRCAGSSVRRFPTPPDARRRVTRGEHAQ